MIYTKDYTEAWRTKFARRLYVLVKQSGYTIYHLSVVSRISIASITGYLNGEHVPNVYTLNNLAKALKCKASDLLNFEEGDICEYMETDQETSQLRDQ